MTSKTYRRLGYLWAALYVAVNVIGLVIIAYCFYRIVTELP